MLFFEGQRLFEISTELVKTVTMIRQEEVLANLMLMEVNCIEFKVHVVFGKGHLEIKTGKSVNL